MNRAEFLKYHEELRDRMGKILEAKNDDYSGSDDAFANFEAVEKLGICSAEQGILTRMSDKFMRVSTFIKRGIYSVSDEKVEDTLIDLCNYTLILASLIKGRKSHD